MANFNDKEYNEYEQRDSLLSQGKSIHHLVAQPGPGNGRKFTQSKRDSWTGHNIKTSEAAMQHLEDAYAQGKMACDWGCTRKVQSRGCAIHAQIRWSK